MKTQYVAKDGKVFDNARDCENYEDVLNGNHIFEVTLNYVGTKSTSVIAKTEAEALMLAKEELEYWDIDWDEDPDIPVTITECHPGYKD